MEALALTELLGLRAQVESLVRLVRLGLLVIQEALVLRAQVVALVALEAKGLQGQLDPLGPQDQAVAQQEPLALLALLEPLLLLEQMAKCNTTMAALQWAELLNFTTMIAQIE
jgi:hypothetical protein